MDEEKIPSFCNLALFTLWGISTANANILFEIFVTHHFTNSRNHVFNGKFAMDVYCIWDW